MTMLPSLCVEFDVVHHTFKQVSLEALASQKVSNTIIRWIHCNLNEANSFNQLSKTLSLPDNVVRLCNKEETIPTLMDSGKTLTVRVRCLVSREYEEGNQLKYGTLVIHLTPHYCLTVTADDVPAVDEFNRTYSNAVKYAKTPCFILFLLLDSITNDFSSVLYDIELISDEVDTQIRMQEEPNIVYQEVVTLKKQITKVKRYMTAIRDILMRISGRKIEAVSEQCRVSLANLFDHTHMIVSKADAIRESLNSTLDHIDNILIHKMSQSMKVLTAFSAFFLPLTLIAGIYGMNFIWIPELHWQYGYFWALSLMAICIAILFYVFRKMKWL